MTTPAGALVAEDTPATPRLGSVGVGLLAALIYIVVVGGSGSGELDPFLRVLNAGLAGVLMVAYVVLAPLRADRLDRVILLALILFVAAGVLSQFLRQSVDAVLAATAYAAAFFVARQYMAGPALRRGFVRVLLGLSAAFTVSAALLWLPRVLEWWVLADRTVMPPLDLPLSAGPWGYRYDVALLIAMLYPAWWMDRPSAPRRLAGVLVGLVAVVVIIVAGSRTTWVAIAIASAVIGLPMALRLWRRYPRARVPAVLLSVVTAVGAVVSGAATPLAERLLAFASLDWRVAMWVPLTDLWLDHPLAGIGPGAFPWALQLTPYFDTRTWAPRHPDNALFQVLPEAGLLGLAALLLAGVAVLVAVFRGHSIAARWVAIVVVVTTLGSNPTDFAFLVAVGIAWAAYACPSATHPPRTPEPSTRSPRLRTITLAAVGVVAALHASTLAAGFAYEQARIGVSDRSFERAEQALSLAIRLDPGMALYHRQRGTVAYLEGNASAAVADLERAVELNRSDDLAWRMLALAHEASGQPQAAHDAVTRAADAQRSDVTNILLLVRAAVEEGRSDDAAELLAELVQSWPTAVAAPEWTDLLPETVTTRDILDAAADRWLRGAATPEIPSDQGIWLGILADRPDVLDVAIQRWGDERLPRGLAAVISCQDDASSVLADPKPAELRTHAYWQVRFRASVLEGDVDLDALQILQIMAGGSYVPPIGSATLNPLNENTGLSADRWGYRRYPIQWPEGAVTLPSVHAGSAIWMFEPRAAVRAANLEDRLPRCSAT